MRFLFVLGFIAYPFIVYLLIDHLQPIYLVAIFALLAVARLLLLRGISKKHLILAFVALFVFCIFAYLDQHAKVLKLYPVFICLIAAIFGTYTLFYPPSAIERLSTAFGVEVSTERASNYVRGVTFMWVCFFCINGLIAAITALSASTQIWAFYNGFLSYIIIGVLFACEYLFRINYRKKHHSL